MKKMKKINSRRGAEKQRAQRGNMSGVATPDPALPVRQTPPREAITPEVIPNAWDFEEPVFEDAAERIRFHLSQAKSAATAALKHIIEAGWELAQQKQLLGYGQWNAWCEQKLSIERHTADRYILAFQKTVGAARAAQRVPLDAKLLKKELDAATEGMEEKTVRQAMIEIGVIKPAAGHGGKREGAGRPAELPTPSAAANAKAIWSEVLKVASKKTVVSAVALLDERTTEVCWGTVLELYEALKDHRAEFKK